MKGDIVYRRVSFGMIGAVSWLYEILYSLCARQDEN
jgi:hypothetical protein